MSVLFNVVFKWGNIPLIFVMHYKKFIVVFKWGSLRLYLWCIIKGSSNIIMGYKYDIIYISFSLFTNFLFTNHFFTSGLFNTSYISFYKKILKYQYFWLKIVLTDTIAILYIYEYDFNLCFLYEKNMIWQTQDFY